MSVGKSGYQDVKTWVLFWKGLKKLAYHKKANDRKFKPTFEDLVQLEKYVRKERKQVRD